MRKTLLLLALMFSPLFAPRQAFACSCFRYENTSERFRAYFDNADLVIQGIPMEVTEGKIRAFSISVEKVWKGQADAYVTIETALDSATCGIELQKNTRYIIFASESEGQYSTGLCSGTVSVAEGKDITEWLSTYDGNGVVPSPAVADCAPYVCGNGETVPACTEDGSVINYLVAPCQFKGGEAAEKDGELPGVTIEWFMDAPPSHPNAKAIEFVRNRGIVQGYFDGTFRPDQFINRAEFTTIIIRSLFGRNSGHDACDGPGAEINYPVTLPAFTDIPREAWYWPPICTAWLNALIEGYPDGSFKPSQTINFAETSKIVVGAFGIKTSPNDLKGAWWKPYVFALARSGGLPTSFTDPNQPLTRGEMAEIFYRILNGHGN